MERRIPYNSGCAIRPDPAHGLCGAGGGAGRVLAGAGYLSRLPVEKNRCLLICVRAHPDGVAQDVLVTWTEASGLVERGKATALYHYLQHLYPQPYGISWDVPYLQQSRKR